MSVLADSLPGEVAEWSNALDLKSSEPKGSVSSNLTLSVNKSEYSGSDLRQIDSDRRDNS